MHRLYFPKCEIDGDIEPAVPYNHMGLLGAIPKKCSGCQFQFEGGCTRNLEGVGRYLSLDHGSCGVTGPTDPVYYEDTFVRSKVEVPRKCSRCVFLKIDRIYGLFCAKDSEKWGKFPRGLDWGAWEPESVYLELEGPKVTTRELANYAKNSQETEFIKEYRKINPDYSIKEAKKDYSEFRKKLRGGS